MDVLVKEMIKYDLILHYVQVLIYQSLHQLEIKNLDRVTELKFAKKHGIEIDTVAKKFSIDQNLWGRAIEGGVLEDPYNEPPDDAFIWVKTKNLPDKPTYLEIKFEKGIPVAVDGKTMEPVKLIEYLNKKAGAAGVGIVDHIEDRVVGIKSREVYETPAATCLIEAHTDLEKNGTYKT